jgi:hypothetical protein
MSPLAKTAENPDLNKAIDTMREKAFPNIVIPQEEWKSIYDMLEVWDKQREDQDIQGKTKTIYDFIKEHGDPKDTLVTIFTTIGSTPVGDTKVNRVFRYVKLKMQAEKTLKEYETIQNEINYMRML